MSNQSKVTVLPISSDHSPAPLLKACDESAFAIDQIRILTLTAANRGRAVHDDVLAALFAGLDSEIGRMKAACGIPVTSSNR